MSRQAEVHLDEMAARARREVAAELHVASAIDAVGVPAEGHAADPRPASRTRAAWERPGWPIVSIGRAYRSQSGARRTLSRARSIFAFALDLIDATSIGVGGKIARATLGSVRLIGGRFLGADG
jgi:hypothetical protein